MRMITIKCPECGAIVNTAPHAESARCDYCGVTAQVRGRSRVLQLPGPMPPPSDGMPIATARPDVTAVVIIGGAVLLVSGVGVAIAMVVAMGGSSSTHHPPEHATVSTGATFMTIDLSTPEQKARRLVPGWSGVGRPVLIDLNADGVDDVVGRVRTMKPEDVFAMAAFNGSTGARMWISSALGPRDAWINTRMGVVGDAIVIGDSKAGLVGLSVRDGSLKWKIRVNERIERLCAGTTSDTVTVFTADKKGHTIGLADGAITPSDSTGCEPVMSDEAIVDQPALIKWSWSNDYRDLTLEKAVDGFYSHESVHYVPGAVAIALGHKTPGSQVPMIAAYSWSDPASGKAKPDVRWTVVVPGGDPLDVREGDPRPAQIAASSDFVVVAYELKQPVHGFRLTAFRMNDGARAWDIGLPGDRPLAAIAASSSHVWVSRWDGLTAYDLKTGELAFAIE